MQNNDASLSAFFDTQKVNFRLVPPSSFAHVVIDVQEVFSKIGDENYGNAQTETIAGRIADLMPTFRDAGIRTAVVYSDSEKEGFDVACGGPHRIEADKSSDIMIPKSEDSAFKGSDIDKIFRKEGIKTLLVSGFNATACVKETVWDALRKKYNVITLEDCIGQDSRDFPSRARSDLETMRLMGAHGTTAENALSFLRRAWDRPTVGPEAGAEIDSSPFGTVLSYAASGIRGVAHGFTSRFGG